jgi:hypothetical protein
VIGELSKIITPVLNDEIVLQSISKAVEKSWDSTGFSLIRAALEDPGLDQRVINYGVAIQNTSTYAVDQLADFIKKLERFETVEDRADLNGAIAAFQNAIIAIGQLDAQDLEETSEPLGKIVSLLSNSLNIIVGDISQNTDMYLMSSAASISSGRSRRAQHPLPPSQVVGVYGWKLFSTCAEFFCPIYSGRQVRWNGSPKCDSCDKTSVEPRVNLLDAQKWLRAELAVAHELLCQPDHLQLWHQLANPESGLAEAIRSGHLFRSSQLDELVLDDSPAFEFIDTPPSDQDRDKTLPRDSTVEDFRKYFFKKLHQPHLAE